jgi:hypothetical protein
MKTCTHNDIETLVIAMDDCSLQCPVCGELLLELELQTAILEVVEDDGSVLTLKHEEN